MSVTISFLPEYQQGACKVTYLPLFKGAERCLSIYQEILHFHHRLHMCTVVGDSPGVALLTRFYLHTGQADQVAQ